jgi:hypothetical protein
VNTGARIALVVGGAFAALFASLLLVLGAVALWGDSQKDERGYVTTDTHHFEAGTRALASENLDVDLDSAEWVFDETDLGAVSSTWSRAPTSRCSWALPAPATCRTTFAVSRTPRSAT